MWRLSGRVAWKVKGEREREMSEKGLKERDLGRVRPGKALTWGSLVLGN